jgi:hypothetical protein
MTHERLDIVQLIENNPLEKLSNHYQTQLLDKIKETFSDSDQQLFIASFYCYLKYNCKTDFIIEMDDVWKWLGFSRRDPCKRLIEKHFTKNTDYKILLHQIVEQVHGGHNKEKIIMNVETFKSLCLLNEIPNFVTIEKNHIPLTKTSLDGKVHQLEKLKKKKYSRFTGVTIRNDNGKFRAYIKHNGKVIHCGTFKDELDAAKAYNLKAKELNKLESTQTKYELNNLEL